MKFIQHIPNFVDNERSKIFSFNNKEELLKIDVVKKHSENELDDIPFYQYSIKEYCGDNILMAEWKNKHSHKWKVIGYVDGSVSLPKFTTS